MPALTTGKNKPMSWKHRGYIPLPLVFLLMLVQFAATQMFTINTSDSSVPMGVYRVIKVPRDKLKVGDVVALQMPLKEVLALPGMHVRFAREGIYVEGKLVRNTAPEPGLPHCPFGEQTVPLYFFVGDGTLDPDSWGSRYYCFAPESIIQAKVKRLW